MPKQSKRQNSKKAVPSLSGKYAAYMEDRLSSPFSNFCGLTPWFGSMEELQQHIASENDPVAGNEGPDRAIAEVLWEGSFELLCNDEAEWAQFIRNRFFDSVGSDLANRSITVKVPSGMIFRFSKWLETDAPKFGEI